MTTYVTNDGAVFTASNHNELVSKLRESSFTSSTDAREFMREVARRVTEQTDIAVSTKNATEFVASLIAVGFLKVKDDEDAKEA